MNQSRDPTELPTHSPTTPAPLHVGKLVCGDRTYVEVRMVFDGDMTFKATNSAFAVSALTVLELNTTMDKEVLALHNLEGVQ